MKDISYRGFTLANSGSHMLPVVIFHTHEGKGKAPPAADFFADVKEAKEEIDRRVDYAA